MHTTRTTHVVLFRQSTTWVKTHSRFFYHIMVTATPFEKAILKEFEPLRIPEAEPNMSKLQNWTGDNMKALVR
jgi:hypothetical protein